MDITIGARGSRLSQTQTREVLQEIQTFYPQIRFLPTWITTCGDQDQTTPLWKVTKTDFFTQEIDERQLNHEFRIAIHSAKDLPNPIPGGLKVVAITKGVDPRDSLVMVPEMTLSTLPPRAKIGTSSKRREAAIHALRPDLETIDIRGTIDKRLSLLQQGTIYGLIIAQAALIRLELQVNHIILEHETEPFQGQLAVVARSSDSEIKNIFSSIDSRR